MSISSEAGSRGEGFVFRLFVAGDEPHSTRAKDNLKRLCESHLKDACEIEILDVLECYKPALENNILLTPALLMVSPLPAVTVYGDLSDTGELIKALRLGGDN